MYCTSKCISNISEKIILNLHLAVRLKSLLKKIHNLIVAEGISMSNVCNENASMLI